MGCGRFEKNCNAKVSLAGPHDPSPWFKHPREFASAWENFSRKYSKVYSDEFLEECAESETLPEQDFGDYMLGTTCLRKAQLTFMINNCLLEKVYDMARVCEERENQGDPMEKNMLYRCSEDKAAKMIEEIDVLEMCIADEGRPLPKLAEDDTFWEAIDCARQEASSGVEARLIEMVRTRAYEHLGVGSDDLETVDDEEDEEDDECVISCDEEVNGLEDDEDDYSRGPRNEGFGEKNRKRSKIVLDDDEEEKTAPKRTRRAVVDEEESSECEEKEPRVLRSRTTASEASTSMESGQVEVNTRGAAARRHPRAGPVEFSKAQRIPGGALAARETVLTELTKLKLRLMSAGNRLDSEVCTAAIFQMEADGERLRQLSGGCDNEKNAHV